MCKDEGDDAMVDNDAVNTFIYVYPAFNTFIGKIIW